MIRATSSISNDLKDVISTIQGYSGCKDVFAIGDCAVVGEIFTL